MAHWRWIPEDRKWIEIDEIRKVMNTGFLTEGSTTKEFEDMVADYVGVKHAIAVTSCTTGLHAVLECLNIKGQELLCRITHILLLPKQ